MQLLHFYHAHRIHQLARSKFWLFEFSIWLHVLARSLIAVFVPILLVRSGYSLGEVMWYYALYCAIDVPLNFAVRKFIRVWGARWAIIVGNIAVIGFFAGFYVLEAGMWPLLILLAFLAAAYDAFYWVGHLYLFMQYEEARGDAEKDTSILYAVKQIAAVLGPGVGALILLFGSQRGLIVTSIVFFILSLMPLFKMKEEVHQTFPREKQLSFREFFRGVKERRNYGSIALFSFHGSAEGVIWPLFVFTIFGTLESVAYLPVIVSLTAIIFTYFAGNIPREKRTGAIILGAGLIALTWLLRLWSGSPFISYGTVFLTGFFSILVSVPVDSRIFERGKELGDPLSASMYRNAISMGMKIFFYGALALLVDMFKASFTVAALATFGLVLLHWLFLAWRKNQEQEAGRIVPAPGLSRLG